MNIEDVRSVEELIQYRQTGGLIQYFHFWGHQAKVSGVIDASCLSQWFPSPFEASGITHATAEHYMMAEKARAFGDLEMFERILQAPSPLEAKKFGRKVSGFNESHWKEICFKVVVEGNMGKFGSNRALEDFLLSTGSSVLVEASPTDCIWGIGMGMNHVDAEVPEKWPGRNLLGFALMEVRKQLLQRRNVR